MALTFYMENNKILYGYSLLNILWTIKDVAGGGGEEKYQTNNVRVKPMLLGMP